MESWGEILFLLIVLFIVVWRFPSGEKETREVELARLELKRLRRAEKIQRRISRLERWRLYIV